MQHCNGLVAELQAELFSCNDEYSSDKSPVAEDHLAANYAVCQLEGGRSKLCHLVLI